MAEEHKSKTFRFNIETLRSRIFFSFALIALCAFIFFTYQNTKYSSIIAKNRIFNQTIEATQKHFLTLHNDIQETNILLIRQISANEGSFRNRRDLIWDNNIPPVLDSLDALESTWAIGEIAIQYTTLKIKIKRLKKAQEEVDEFVSKDTATGASEIEKKGFFAKINLNTLFREKILENTQEINEIFDKIKIAQNNLLESRNKVFDEVLYGFWTFTLLLFLGFIVLVIALGFFINQKFQKDFRVVFLDIKKLSEGNLIAEDYQATGEMGLIENLHKVLSEKLRQSKKALEEIAKGNFNKQEIFDQKSDLGKAFSNMYEGLLDIAKQDEERSWTNEGVKLFGQLLRANDDTSVLYDSIISSLVKYLDASQGGLFILSNEETEDPSLRLEAVYAFDRKRIVNKEVKAGQGLLGQAWLEKDTIHIKQVSKDYVQIVSGLGGASPRTILAVPLLDNERKVLGGIELALFHTLPEYKIAFVERVANMIAGTVSSLKSNYKTTRLLRDARHAARKLKMEDKRMKAYVSELKKTEAERVQNQVELEGQTMALNTTLALIEYDVEGNIINANQQFLQSMNYESENIENSNFITALDKRTSDLLEYQAMWENLREGLAQRKEVHRVTTDNKEIWFNATYTPVRNTKGQIIKIIELALDVTEQKRLSNEYKAQIEAINKSNAMVEFDDNGTIIDANGLYLDLVGYTLEEIKGKNHRIFIADSERENYETFGERLKQGESIVGRFKQITKKGKTIWLSGTYSPIPDLDGKIHRVIQLANDITYEVKVEEELRRIKS